MSVNQREQPLQRPKERKADRTKSIKLSKVHLIAVETTILEESGARYFFARREGRIKNLRHAAATRRGTAVHR